MIRAIILVLMIQFFYNTTQARQNKYFSIYPQYHSYQDIISSSENAVKKLSNDYSLSLEARLYRVFIFSLTAGQSTDLSRKFTAIGFKAELPGFFLLGGNVNDLIRRKKREGINTYLHWRTYILQAKGEAIRSVATRFALGADISIYKALYLNLEMGIYSHKGDQFISPGLGIVVEF